MVNANTPAEVEITERLVRALLEQQCPVINGTETALLSLAPFNNGWDNDIWALGDDLLVRMPRRRAAATLIANEQSALPLLAPRLRIPVPVPVHAGVAQGDYPWKWSVVPRFPGARAAESVLADPEEEAERLAWFLRDLHTPAPQNAPHNQYRGMGVASRGETFREIAAVLPADELGYDAGVMHSVWSLAESVPGWADDPVWLHGDLHTANIIVNEGRISAVVDWGDVCSGDPACDLSVAWQLFDAEARDVFFGAYGEGARGLHERAEAWALLFGLVYWRASESDPLMERMSRAVLGRIIGRDH